MYGRESTGSVRSRGNNVKQQNAPVCTGCVTVFDPVYICFHQSGFLTTKDDKFQYRVGTSEQPEKFKNVDQKAASKNYFTR